MTAPAQLAASLRRTIDGPMWHGPAIRELLIGVDARAAAARPVVAAHSIWELVLHMASWAEICERRLRGESLGDPDPEGDWPPVPADATAEAWAQAQARVASSYERLASAAESLSAADLARPVGERGYDAATMLQGTVEHGAYHGGQIALLKRALVEPKGSV
ncbi:MAG TPA: DinB family protein [Gemmatimonadaceae bacterium]|nr:DinB family protein [Gemmatimonadaceae bacterium]